MPTVSAANPRRARPHCCATAPAARLPDPESLLAYHDCLLFLLAYPESAALLAAARRELARVAAAARVIIETGPERVRAKLDNSGIAWAPTTIAFGYDIARWLAERHPRHAEIDSFDESGAALPALLRHALPALEFEMLAADDATSDDFLATASAGHRGTRLQWLVAQCAALPCPDGLREHLFDALKAYITINPGDGALTRTFVRGLAGMTFFHRGDLLRRVDAQSLVAMPLAPPPALSSAQRAHLLDAGRAMLASLGRETDAISAALPAGIEYHALDRGVAIALYTMAPGRRLPLDSHVGFMLFKNSIPVGYGGGWPFLGTARIGVNVFSPFRGGESAYLFCQVLRVYSQRFGVDRFIAEPSQFGGGNREGLESGAFWFYYRLGFRPVASRLAALAADEYARMQRAPGYRPPLPVLRRFTRSDIELRLRPGVRGAPGVRSRGPVARGFRLDRHALSRRPRQGGGIRGAQGLAGAGRPRQSALAGGGTRRVRGAMPAVRPDPRPCPLAGARQGAADRARARQGRRRVPLFRPAAEPRTAACGARGYRRARPLKPQSRARVHSRRLSRRLQSPRPRRRTARSPSPGRVNGPQAIVEEHRQSRRARP